MKIKKGHTVFYVDLPLIELFDPVITLPGADADPITAITEISTDPIYPIVFEFSGLFISEA